MVATALVVLVPEADPLIGNLRAKHTPGGRRGMPSHITLLVPFVDSERLDDSVLEKLRRAVGGGRAFDFALTETARFDTGVLYLVGEPVEPIRQLISRLCAAFPDCAPYGGEFAPQEVIPHCTIAVGQGFPNGPTERDRELFSRCEARVRPSLPIVGRAEDLAVMADESSGWRPVTKIALGT